MALLSCLVLFIHFGKQTFSVINSFDKWTEKVQIYSAMGLLYADMSVGARILEVSWKLRQYIKTWVIHAEVA